MPAVMRSLISRLHSAGCARSKVCGFDYPSIKIDLRHTCSYMPPSLVGFEQGGPCAGTGPGRKLFGFSCDANRLGSGSCGVCACPPFSCSWPPPARGILISGRAVFAWPFE